MQLKGWRCTRSGSGGPQAPPPCHVAGVMPNCQSPYNRLWLAACTLFDLRLGFIGGLKLLSSFLSEASFIHSFILSRWFIHGGRTLSIGFSSSRACLVVSIAREQLLLTKELQADGIQQHRPALCRDFHG